MLSTTITIARTNATASSALTGVAHSVNAGAKKGCNARSSASTGVAAR